MIDWHYPRTDLAKAYLDQFATGITSALTLFAPRRYGKTEFLLRDLVPAAEEQGYRVVYASMWASRADPLSALLAAIDAALTPHGLTEKIRGVFSGSTKSVELEVGLAHAVKVRGQVNVAGKRESSKPSALLDLPVKLDTLIRRAKRGRVLLLLDEVQHLAKPRYQDLVAALRTALDTRKDRVKVVYTGSSRVRLQQMFESIHAPLFRASQTTVFPGLDEQFVRFMAENVYQATGRRLILPKAIEGFELVARSPGFFREAIEEVVMGGGGDIVKLCRAIVEKARHGSGYEKIWASFMEIDRAIVMRVVRGTPLYTDAARTALAQNAGGATPTTSQVQARLKTLLRAQVLLNNGRGKYELEDPGFAAWIADQQR